MELETVDDLANQIGDWVGCYGCCKAVENGHNCEDKNIFCCRIGMMLVLPDRIRAAVANDKFLESIK